MTAQRSGLTGKVALVTGAASGMGRACAALFRGEAADLVITDCRPEALRETARQLETAAGGRVEAVEGRVEREADVEAVVRAGAARFGRIDILVHAAGVLERTRFPEISADEWDRVLDINLRGTFLFMKAVYPLMKKQRYGRIINFSSTAGKTVSTLGGAHYTASKHGVLGLTRAFAREAAPFGITCNAVCPGLIDTDMVREFIGEEEAGRFAESFPVARLGRAEEVAALVAFLASEEAGYITGSAYDIAGGDLMV
jgi:NAD(P)-dependent dehydrogenase (short-subunit alcohol dehydrogenase family)